MVNKRSDNRGRENHRAEQKEANRHPVARPGFEVRPGMVRFTDGTLYELDGQGRLLKLEERG